MVRRRLLLPAAPAALVLVAAFVLGGLVAPQTHRALHAAEWAAERSAHTDAHPTGLGDHLGVPCAPDAHALDCALCHVVVVSLFAPSASEAAPGEAAERRPATAAALATEAWRSALSRGPPAPAV